MIGNQFLRRKKTSPAQVIFPEVADIEDVCYPLALSAFTSPDYLMPPLKYHDKSRLEAALGAVKNSYYQTLPELAAALVYYLIKNHPFQDGNKRMGVVVLYTFLAANDFKMIQEIPKDETILLAEKVAGSASSNKDFIIEEITTWINQRFTRAQD